MCDCSYVESSVQDLKKQVESLWKIVRLLSAHVCDTGTPVNKESCETCKDCEHECLKEYEQPCFNCVGTSNFTEKKPPPSRSEQLANMLKLIGHKEKSVYGKS